MDECVYLKVSSTKIIFFILYVDDILLASFDMSLLQSTMNMLTQSFDLKDLGEDQFVLGIEIIRDRAKKSLGLSQRQYIDRVTKRFNMEKCSSGELSIGKGDKTSHEQCPKNELERVGMKDKPYASLVENLILQSNFGASHWVVTKKVKSTNGYIFLLANGAVSWKSWKQKCIASSTIEAKFIGCYATTQQAIWLRNMMKGLMIIDDIERPLMLHCDNKVTVFFSVNNKRSYARRLMDIKYLKVRDEVKKSTIDVEYINTSVMVADLMTKALSVGVFNKHVFNMGVQESFDSVNEWE
ncbi:unnamed protein product [Malus baccata var. baccata]